MMYVISTTSKRAAESY